MFRRFPTLSLLAACLVLFTPGACGPEKATPVAREQIEASLRAYLPLLAEGYSSGNLEPLTEHAVEREVNRVYARVSELAEQGKYVAPAFHQMTVEKIHPWGHGNAMVTTFEIWDLRVYATGSDTLLGEELNQANRVVYHLQQQGERWVVFNRELANTIE